MDDNEEKFSFATVQKYVRDSSKKTNNKNGNKVGDKDEIIGGMNLTQLREQLTQAAKERVSADDTNSLLDLVKQKREREKLEELRQMKIKHQQVRARKRQESTEISKVMMELEKRKQQELELRLQKERLQQGLERVDRTHLGQMEEKKRRELDKLTQERKVLQAKEEAILAQVEELEKKIIEQEEMNAKRKQEVEDALVRKKGSRLELKNAELLHLAKAHGQRTSTLLQEREKLEQERQKIEAQLLDLSGDNKTLPSRDQEALDDFVESVQQRIAEQQERVTIMRLEHEQEQKDWTMAKIVDENETKRLRPLGLGTSLPFSVEAESFLNEWLNEDPQHASTMQEARRILDASANSPLPAAPTQGRFSSTGSPNNQNEGVQFTFDVASPRSAKHHKQLKRGMSRANLKSKSNMLRSPKGESISEESRRLLEEEVDALKAEYAEIGVDNPSLWGEIQALEKQLGYRPSKRPQPLRIQVNDPDSAWVTPAIASPFSSPSPRSVIGANAIGSPFVEYQIEKQQRLLDRQAKTLRKIELKQKEAKIKASLEKKVQKKEQKRRKRKSRYGRKTRRGNSDTSSMESSDSSNSYSSESSKSFRESISSPSTSSSPSTQSSVSSNHRHHSPRHRRGGRRHRRQRFQGRARGYDSNYFPQNPVSQYQDFISNAQADTAGQAMSSIPVYGGPQGLAGLPPAEMQQLEQQQKVFSRTLEALTRKLQILGHPNGGIASMPGTGLAGVQGSNGAFSSASATNNSGGVDEKSQFLEELSTLDMIPRDSELYTLQVEHLKMITRMRSQFEELKQEQRMTNVKEGIERKQREDQKRVAFEELKIEHERQLELAKLRRAIAKEGTDSGWSSKPGASSKPYDPQEGFAIYFDYLKGIPKRFGMVRLVYCIYEGETVRSSVKALHNCETESETPTRSVAMFVARKKFQRIPANANLRIVLELQCVIDGPEGQGFQSIGWSVLGLFLGSSSSGVILNEGAHLLTMQRPPFKVEDIAAATKPAGPDDKSAAESMQLFLRLVHMEDLNEASEFVIDPVVTQHMYKCWPPIEEKRVSSTARKKERASTKRGKTKTKKSKHASDSASDMVSVAGGSVLSGETIGGQTVASSASQSGSGAKHPKSKKKRRLEFHLDHLAFADTNPAHPVYVRATLLPDKSNISSWVNEEAQALHKLPDTSITIDYSSLSSDVHVWESEPRDVRVSTGQVAWNRAATNSTFFDGIEFDKHGVLLIKIFERIPEGLADTSSQVNDSKEEPHTKLIGWVAQSLHEVELALSEKSAEDFVLELYQPSVELPVDKDKVEYLGARIQFIVKRMATRRKSVSSASSNASIISRRGQRRAGSVARSIISIAEEDDEDLHSISEGEEEDSEDDAAAEKHKASNAAANEDHDVSKDPWIEHRARIPGDQPLFERGEDGFDVYIDAARFLPDYTTITAVHVKLLAPNFEQIGEESQAYPRLGDSAYNPSFRLRCEFRGEAIANPASTLLIRIDTVDRFTKATKALGYTCLHPFCLRGGGGEQPAKATTQEFSLNAGAFQLPLYQVRPDTAELFTAKHFDSKSRVPCATLLVRILPAKKGKDNVHILRLDEFPEDEWEKRGLVVPAPHYGSSRQKYDSSRCVPLPCENKLYKVLADREEVLVGEMCTLARRPGVTEDKHVDVMEDDEVHEWIHKRLSQPQGMMPIDHATQYQPEVGFGVAIEALLNLRSADVGKNKMHKVIFSFSPPGAYYGEPRLTDDVAFTTSHNFEASTTFPKFSDDLHSFRDAPYDPKLVLVIDVRLVRTDKMQQEPYAWGIVPLFSLHGPYINNGRLHAILFTGPVNVSVLTDLQSSDKDPAAFVIEELGRGKHARLKPLKTPSSVMVRVIDNLVIDCMNFDEVRALGVPDSMASKVTSQINILSAPVRKGHNLGAVLPKQDRAQPEAFERSVNEAFAKLTGISNYTF